MKRRFTVGILGAGRMAAGFDAPGDPWIRSLAHAVTASKRLRLGGFFDIKPAAAAAAERKWDCPPSPRQRDAWLDAGWDVVFIATPTAAHARDFRDVLSRRPRAVLIEKPFATDGAEALTLLRRAQRAAVPVVVDFPRREHPAVRRITRLFRANRFGRILRISGTYRGGVEHNGVHMLDLVSRWLPPVRSVRRVSAADGITHLRINTARGPVPMLLADAAQPGCAIWELRIETEGGRIDFADAPELLRVFRIANHPNYPGFPALLPERTWPMEEEPLPLRVAEHLTTLIESRVAARAQWALELAAHQFFNQVFTHFEL